MIAEVLQIAEETQLVGTISSAQLLQEQPAVETRQHTHRQKEAQSAGDPAIAVRRQPAARHDAVDVRVMAPTPTIPSAPIIQMFRSSTPFTHFMVLPCGFFADRSEEMGRSVS